MSTALHAQRIVDAWDGFNYTRFQAELESALMTCHSSAPCSEMDSEEQWVLESVVRRLRRFPAVSDHDDQNWFAAGILLLRHLRNR